ncbi:hypothetical protein GCM10010435_81170 [Winogradskya consettensis]|uniref:Uncharacterized protein n=1 Tax=Winogradskya consettensis TaxID=113560 RepID=A0A919SNA1_9ACTN|nr:hypothetical protein [Actinoplanes consettensis]GIM75975.1 hypothetical protein Aco04nite_48020 [Actinoplanes consettensis]
MDTGRGGGYAVRVLGTLALAAGFLVAAMNAVADTASADAYFFAGLFVISGLGLRLEAAIRSRP